MMTLKKESFDQFGCFCHKFAFVMRNVVSSSQLGGLEKKKRNGKVSRHASHLGGAPWGSASLLMASRA
jgi:hypothetical protein